MVVGRTHTLHVFHPSSAIQMIEALVAVLTPDKMLLVVLLKTWLFFLDLKLRILVVNVIGATSESCLLHCIHVTRDRLPILTGA